ncbi:TPA: hypothetical protein DEP58_01985 [Patescibacteria group bacterium]|nr:MAG: hypothetical protein UU98_C0004G0002 [Parcubacteria group bacterium GW2011_GWD2_42_14]HCC05056.1 hypothetical protein [Patescibacteria group bacterium]
MNEKMFSRNENALPEAENTAVRKPTEGTDYADLLEKYTIHPIETASENNSSDIARKERTLHELNLAVENARPEEREEKMKELLEWEAQLDAIENALGVNTEIADVALTEVCNETLDIPNTLIQLEEENPELAEVLQNRDEEKVKGFLMSLTKKMQGSKLAKTVGLWTAITIGGMSVLGHTNVAEGADLQTKTKYSKEYIATQHAEVAKTNMGSLFIKVNSNPDIDPTIKLLFLNGIKKTGTLKDLKDMKVIDYVSSGNLTDKEIEAVLKLAEQ